MIFVDSAAFIALQIEQDVHHARSSRLWSEFKAESVRCTTSNFVLSEVITFLARRGTYRLAANTARTLYASRALEILRPGPEEETEAIRLFEKYADQEVSFTDAVSFALMRRLGIKRAFTFDRHFRLAGFEVIP